MGNLIYAPWTDEQVAALNRWQACDWVHPFTCGNRDSEVHKTMARISIDEDTLIATNTGWHCPACGYTQNWAHDFMTQPPPENPFKKEKI